MASAVARLWRERARTDDFTRRRNILRALYRLFQAWFSSSPPIAPEYRLAGNAGCECFLSEAPAIQFPAVQRASNPLTALRSGTQLILVNIDA
jgi:hypothetical protein